MLDLYLEGLFSRDPRKVEYRKRLKDIKDLTWPWWQCVSIGVNGPYGSNGCILDRIVSRIDDEDEHSPDVGEKMFSKDSRKEVYLRYKKIYDSEWAKSIKGLRGQKKAMRDLTTKAVSDIMEFLNWAEPGEEKKYRPMLGTTQDILKNELKDFKKYLKMSDSQFIENILQIQYFTGKKHKYREDLPTIVGWSSLNHLYISY